MSDAPTFGRRLGVDRTPLLLVIVVREAVGDRWCEAHHQSLADLQAKYADVVDIESALDDLRQTSRLSSDAMAHHPPRRTKALTTK